MENIRDSQEWGSETKVKTNIIPLLFYNIAEYIILKRDIFHFNPYHIIIIVRDKHIIYNTLVHKKYLKNQKC